MENGHGQLFRGFAADSVQDRTARSPCTIVLFLLAVATRSFSFIPGEPRLRAISVSLSAIVSASRAFHQFERMAVMAPWLGPSTAKASPEYRDPSERTSSCSRERTPSLADVHRRTAAPGVCGLTADANRCVVSVRSSSQARKIVNSRWG